ncbi:MAG: hypothetical protein EOO61_23205 [Hymenobacter sp.]|nr:MAG: hypothetical protein EOO61_23205 [Hymenobacter sp.]
MVWALVLVLTTSSLTLAQQSGVFNGLGTKSGSFYCLFDAQMRSVSLELQWCEAPGWVRYLEHEQKR